MCIISLIPHNHPGKQIPRYHQRSTLWKRSGIQTGCPGVFSEQIPRSGFLEQKDSPQISEDSSHGDKLSFQVRWLQFFQISLVSTLSGHTAACQPCTQGIVPQRSHNNPMVV
ncbi:uncharacterized protein LOC144294659 isoform X2 [Canis aureus]